MIENIEKYIIDFKRKIGSKNVFVIFFLFFVIILLLSMIYINNYKKSRDNLMNIYNKSMYNMVGYIENIEAYSLKARITKNSVNSNTIYSKIATYAGFAKEALSSLPIGQDDMNKISKFLSQTIGYYTYLEVKSFNKVEFTEEDNENLKNINEIYVELTKVMKDIYKEISSGNLKWDEVEDVVTSKLVGKEFEDETLPSAFSISKPFTEYEGLIYDGAYSNHLETLTPKLIENESVLTKEEAQQLLKEKITGLYKNYNLENIIFKNEISGKLQLYEYEVKFKEIESTMTIQVTKQGGLINLMLFNTITNSKNNNINIYNEDNTRDVSSKINIAEEYLKKLGIENLISTYTIIQDNSLLINFAAVENDVIMYPDLIKIKINLDTNVIEMLEATGYIFNHINRDTKIVDMDENGLLDIKEKYDVDISTKKLCVIPTESGKEIYCYEFSGKVGNNNFLIYLNTKTLEEENVLILIDVSGGKLTR